MSDRYFTKNLGVGHGQENRVLSSLDLNINERSVTCLIGENGSGKSTLLKTLAGSLKPLAGSISLDGKELSNWSSRELARKIVYVPSTPLRSVSLSVEEVVSLGRYPFKRWGSLSSIDRRVVKGVLEKTDLAAYRNEPLWKLSDGLKQKVAIARALCQEAAIVLLDEPFSFLDVASRNSLLSLFYDLARDGNAVVYSSHDWELCLKGAQTAWAITKGKLFCGPPEELVIEDLVKEVFPLSKVPFNKELGSFDFPRPAALRYSVELFGVEGPRMLWTSQALEKIGCQPVPKGGCTRVEVSEKGWSVAGKSYTSLREVLCYIKSAQD